MNMRTPSAELITFFLAHGRPSACTTAEARQRSDSYMTRAIDIMEHISEGDQSCSGMFSRVDDIVALCTGAVYSAHGFNLKNDETALKGSQALDVLAAELHLSFETSAPLQQVRRRTAELMQAATPRDSDAFLSLQGAMLSTALVEWTSEFVVSTLPC